jgi:hypothetical protein
MLDTLLKEQIALFASDLLARFFALAAFGSTRLTVSIIRKRFARLGTMVAALRTAIRHHNGQRRRSHRLGNRQHSMLHYPDSASVVLTWPDEANRSTPSQRHSG